MARLRVEVVYALPGGHEAVTLSLPGGATVQEAVESSGLLERCRELAAGSPKLGIFGKVVTADTRLKDGDRVEIYRPLLVDPREARRRRAQRSRLRRR